MKFLIVRAKKTFMEFFHEKEQWSGPKRERFLLDVDLIKEDGVVGDDPWWEKDKRQSRKKWEPRNPNPTPFRTFSGKIRMRKFGRPYEFKTDDVQKF